MINVFKKIWKFSENEQTNIKKSLVIGVCNAIFNAMQLWAIFVVLSALLDSEKSLKISGYALGIMLISIIGKIVTQYFSQLQRVHAGYFMAADKRIKIGNKLRSVPMGFFNQNSLGTITATATTILSDVETTAPIVLVTTLGGFLNAAIFAIAIILVDWRMGIIVLLGIAVFLFVISRMEKKSRKDAPLRQEAQQQLVSAVLETVQGMSVVKAFNLEDKKDKRVDTAIEESFAKNEALERTMIPFSALQQIVLNMFSVILMITSSYLYVSGKMQLVNCLMMLIASFIIFEQLKAAGSGTAILRLTETSIDRANKIDEVPVMDENGTEIKLKHCDIAFKDVSFSYEKRKVLDHIDVRIPEKTITAVIGPSGSGKTTFCNLIARFWDVESGQVTIDGNNVKNFTLDSLMKNISMVFQNVYLFADTIENNIKFGKPNATHEEVVAAAKKACCHEFIKAFPDGYNTIIGEGGASLSGGEKQRISIARAMLKDAPIIIFDEATANIDPENEDRLQAAIEALTNNKTIIMIAHRLKTVRNADQIVVLNHGNIVQKGTHDELMKAGGIYADFVGIKEKTLGWKLASS